MNQNPIESRYPSFRRIMEQRGFALVVTLLLLVLLTTIAIGLLSLSSISIRLSETDSNKKIAMANARLALMLALNELQTELGPDQRISAPGGQQLAEDDKSAGKHWTGVYDSWPAGSEIRPAPVFRRWLISGEESVVTDPKTPSKSLLPARKVPLVSAYDDTEAIEAGLISLPLGSCAWWVGDQSTKAKLGGSVQPANDDEIASNRMQSAPRAAHEGFVGNALKSSDPALDRLISIPTWDIITNPAQSSNAMFHHATSTSLGLITNVRGGGLRKDLNFLLETPKPSQSYALPLYMVGNSPGINLGELWVDHNIWAELAYPSTPPKHADGSTIPNGLPILTTASVQNDVFMLYKHLPRLQLTILYSLYSELNSSGKYDLYLVVDPVFTVWNPFDACLHIPTASFATFKSWAIPYNLDLTFTKPDGSTTSTSQAIKDLSSAKFAPYFFYGQLGRSQNLVLRPGEVQVIAQGFNASIALTSKGYKFDGKLGWEFAAGYKYKIPFAVDGSQMITYTMKPNNGRTKFGMFMWSYLLGDVNESAPKYLGSYNIDILYAHLPSEPVGTPNQFPGVFPPLPADPSAKKTVAALRGQKWPICVFTYGLRTAEDPAFEAATGTQGTRFSGRSMLRANETSMGQDLFMLQPDVQRLSPLQIGMRRVNSLNSPIIECDATGLGYYGAGYTAATGATHVITRSIPRAPIHSLGALQHGAAEARIFNQRFGEESFGRSVTLPAISHPIANSFAPSFLAPGEVRGKLAGRNAGDHSYLVNMALWDDYFYSSIKPRTTSVYRDAKTAHYEQKERLRLFVSKDTDHESLPNKRMEPWVSNPEDVIATIFSDDIPAFDAAERIASYLMVDGTFNVNSTSVKAWKGFLSGLKGEKVPVSPTPGLKDKVDLEKTEGTPIAAILHPGAGVIDEASLSDPSDPKQWIGFRSLKDEQMDELAKAIVKQVRLRGPFLSIADFVNRRPGNDKNLALSGPLQSALDDPSVSINAAYRKGKRALPLADAVAQGFPFPEAEAGPKSVMAPGYVKQGDLLTPLGPLISVRGDTFVIRAYGEALDPSGTKVLANAWCEATVQRIPDFVDPSDAAHLAYPSSLTNQTFGRRFNIVSFRFLNPKEVQ